MDFLWKSTGAKCVERANRLDNNKVQIKVDFETTLKLSLI